MKIALISGSHIPSRTANSMQTMKMAEATARIGHEVMLILPGEKPDAHWNEIASHYGVRLGFPIHWIKPIRALRSYDFGVAAVRQARRWGADVIYTRHPQAAAIAGWGAVPAIFEIHDLPSGNMGPRLMRAFAGGRSACKLVAITKALSQALEAEYMLPKREGFMCIAPDGVDLERYENLNAPRKARQLLGLPEGFTAGYSGHLYAGRGIELILQMAAALPELNFLLIGGEEERVGEVRSQAEQAGLGNLQVLGFIPNQELPRYHAACEALLMPYQQRVAGSSGGDIARYLSPMKMFEYLASGRAVLASDLPVLGEVLVDGENALILPAGDTEAWIEAIRKVQTDPDYRVRLGEKGRETAEEHSWELRARKIFGDL
ncbi:MAG: glycosyltransferase family 4 protein [Anaerolineae bacterium]|nr:glycosyltransferase family 4 protein [Anaerolineae bacterium]